MKAIVAMRFGSRTNGRGGGVGLVGSGTSDNRVEGDYIGTNVAGSVALGT